MRAIVTHSSMVSVVSSPAKEPLSGSSQHDWATHVLRFERAVGRSEQPPRSVVTEGSALIGASPPFGGYPEQSTNMKVLTFDTQSCWNDHVMLFYHSVCSLVGRTGYMEALNMLASAMIRFSKHTHMVGKWKPSANDEGLLSGTPMHGVIQMLSSCHVLVGTPTLFSIYSSHNKRAV